MSLFSEHRLIAKNLSDFTDQTVYNRRNSALNIEQQNAQSAAQTQANTMNGSVAPPVAKVPVSGALANARNTYANKSAGLNTTFTPETGTTQVAGHGDLQQAAIDHLRAAGISDAEIRTRLSDPAYIKRISDTMTGGSFNGAGQYTPPSSGAQAALDALSQEQSKAAQQSDYSADIAAQFSQRKQALQQQIADEKSSAQQRQDMQTAADVNTTSPTANVTTTTNVTTPTEATPAKDLVEEQIKKDAEMNQNQNADSTNAALTGGTVTIGGKEVPVSGIEAAFNEADQQISDLKDQILKAKVDQQANLDAQMAQEKQQLADEEKAARDLLIWNEQQSLRKTSDAETKAMDSKIAQLALSGNAGSSGGMLELDEIRNRYEQNMSDIRTQSGLDVANLAVKFSGLYVQSQKDYVVASNQNIKDTFAALQTNAGQFNASKQARATAENGIVKSFVDQTKQDRKDLVASLREHSNDMESALEVQEKAKQQEEQFNITNEIKREAIRAASQNRVASTGTAAQNHLDMLSQQAASGLTSRLDTIKTNLEKNAAPYDVYINSQQFKSSFDDAYKIFTDPNATQGDRATADAQMAFQFSHFQNIGSLRIQEVAGEAAHGNQSLAAKTAATIDSWLHGGAELDQTTRDAMKNLMTSHVEALQKQATSQVLSAWSAAQGANRNFPNAPSPITPDQLTNDPLLLNAMYQTQDKSAGDWWDSNGSQPAGSGSFSPSGQLSAPAPKLSGFNPKIDLQSATIGSRTVRAQPYLLSALQQADAQLFADTGQHIQVNSDYRDTAAQEKSYKDFLSGKIARAAPPGQSFHEKGLAVDITNFKEVAPYLAQYGVVNGLKNDMGHFSIGELNPNYLANNGSTSGYLASTPQDAIDSNALLQLAMQ